LTAIERQPADPERLPENVTPMLLGMLVWALKPQRSSRSAKAAVLLQIGLHG